jgi:benzoyl-CoA reductase/2-hydroxyglutaryl-CoA dehydratase subunit BcrC/BadD/HgdB
MMLGWVCTYTPEEIFTALGIESYRLCGADRQVAAMRYLPVNLCPMARSCLDEAADLEAAGTPLSGVVMAASCHALVHLANAFRHARGRDGFLVHLLDIPRLLDLPGASGLPRPARERGAAVPVREREAAARVFAADMKDLAVKLSAWYGMPWDEAALAAAIETHRLVRELLQEIFRMRQRHPESFRAAGLLELVRRVGRTRKQELLPALQYLVACIQDGKGNAGVRVEQENTGIQGDRADTGARNGRKNPGIGDGRAVAGVGDGQAVAGLPDGRMIAGLRRRGSPQGPRLLVAGSPLPFAYLDLIEELGGNIAGDDLCRGYRYCLPEVAAQGGSLQGDPFLSLARGYLQRIPCPRMLNGRLRFAHLQGLVRECGARGVVYHALKFCDLSLYEYALLRSRFNAAGIPVLYLETEYRNAGLEQARTRIQAFLELLGRCESPALNPG